MIKHIPGIAWASDILTGQREFPTNKDKSEDKGFQEILDKAMEEKKK